MRLIAAACAISICFTCAMIGENGAQAQTTGLDASVSWDKLPNIGDRRGVWIFSDKSMPWLLAARFDIKNITPSSSLTLSVTGNLIPEAGAGVSMPYAGLSYYLQRANELYRCDELGLGKRYVACWYFEPETISGRAIVNPHKYVGTWVSQAIETPISFTFSDNTFTSRTPNGDVKTVNCSFVFGAGKFSVVIDSFNKIDFDVQSDDVISFKSPYYSGRVVVLKKQ